MNRHRLLFLFVTLATCFAAGGHAAEAPDSLQSVRDASLPTDLTASIMVVTPGTNFTAGFGHCALHVTCLSAGLDRCFSFGLKDSFASVVNILTKGYCDGHYDCVPIDLFVEPYAQQGRGITEYGLNLTLEEIRLLWMNLDNETLRPAGHPYTFIHAHCSSTLINILQRSLIGENIRYGTLGEEFSEDYRHLMFRMMQQMPWAQFASTTIMAAEGERKATIPELLTPNLVEETWGDAVLEGSGGCRPLLTGEKHELLPLITIPKAGALTPVRVFAALLVLTVLVTLAQWLLRWHRVARIYDGILLGVHTLVSVLIVYLVFFSLASWSGGGMMAWVFNPLPFVAWLCLRRVRWSRWLWLLFALVLLFFCVCWKQFPQLLPAHVLLFLTFAIRCLSASFSKTYKQKEKI